MPGFVKPSWPVWQPGKAPAGCKLYLPLTEGAGTTVRDYADGLGGSFVGPASWQPWQQGLYGPQLGGFSTSNYVVIDPPTQILYPGVYPCWFAILAVNTGTTAFATPIYGGSATGTGNPQIGFYYNSSGAGTLQFALVSDSGANASITALGQPINDGMPHVLMGLSYAANDQRLFVDGSQAGANSVSLGTFTAPYLSLGVRRRSTQVTLPFTGSILWAGAGNGSVPDPLSFAQDLLSGRFSAIRSGSNLALWAALAGGSPAPFVGSPAAMMMGF